MRRPRPAGFTLVEVLVAAGVAALVGVAILLLLSQGVRTTAAATEVELACRAGGRIIDRLLAEGYEPLARRNGTVRDIDMSALVAVEEEDRPASEALRTRATAAFSLVEPGLLRIELTIFWNRAAAVASQGRLDLCRYVADPTVAMATREPFRR